MAKKSFMNNLSSALNAAPAEAFISGTAASAEVKKAAAGSADPKPVQDTLKGVDSKDVTAPRETKSQRVQSLLKPSLYEYLKRSARIHGVSANDRLNTLLEEARKSEEG